MVDAIEGELLFANGVRLPLTDAAEVYALPLRKNDIAGYDTIWVEPISTDISLRNELRGWYHVKKRFVENEVGQRF